MKACPKCETPWDDGKRFCPYHGLPLVPVPEPVAALQPAAVDVEVTVRMSDEERAQLFVPQLVETSPSSRLPAAVPSASSEAPASSEASTWSADDSPTLKSQHQAPPPELDPVIPPTVVVSRAALSPQQTESATKPPVLDTIIPPTVVVSPSEVEAILRAQVGAPAPNTSRPEGEALPVTSKADATPTAQVDPSATHFMGQDVEPVKNTTSPPVMDANDDVGFVLDLEKSSTRLPPPPQAAHLPETPVDNPGTPPGGRNLTPSAVPSLVTPPSPTIKRLTAVQYFKLFNERKKVLQQFVHGLDPKRVHITEGHSNQEELLMHRYDLTFRYLASQRTFPLVIILQRKPVYALITSVDLYEIGESPRLREERTKSLGGECKPTPNGVVYHVSYAEDLPTEQFGEWLRATFQGIAQFLPGLSFP